MTYNIAIIIKDSLKNIGLKTIFYENFGIEPKCYTKVPEDLNDIFDLIFTDSESYCSNLDYLIPRRNICVFLENKCNDNGRVIVTVNDVASIINSIAILLNDVKRKKPEIKEELSSREIEVLKLIAKGMTNKEMADTLNISINTILSHRKNITSKLGIRSVSGLTFYAMMHGYTNAQ